MLLRTVLQANSCAPMGPTPWTQASAESAFLGGCITHFGWYALDEGGGGDDTSGLSPIDKLVVSSVVTVSVSLVPDFNIPPLGP